MMTWLASLLDLHRSSQYQLSSTLPRFMDYMHAPVFKVRVQIHDELNAIKFTQRVSYL